MKQSKGDKSKGDIRRTVDFSASSTIGGGKITANQSLLNLIVCACELAADHCNSLGMLYSASSYDEMASVIAKVLEENHYYDHNFYG